jgi:hypothetical protein
MSGFSADWLALREPSDARSRADALLDPLRAWRGTARPLRVVDLGAGTGANLRYLAPRLGGAQDWLLTDDDPGLLSALPGTMRAWADAHGWELAERPQGLSVRAPAFSVDILTHRCDLAADRARLPIGDRDLVTASALLDLVSDDWLEALAAGCGRERAAALLALTYDGRMGFDPHEAEDAEVTALVNRHQLGDKGFGPALGPRAANAATARFAALGYRVHARRSDWHLDGDQAEIQQALIAGWTTAAIEMAPHRSARLEDWRRRRRAHVAARHSHLGVGHVDLLALPQR